MIKEYISVQIQNLKVLCGVKISLKIYMSFSANENLVVNNTDSRRFILVKGGRGGMGNRIFTVSPGAIRLSAYQTRFTK